MAETETKKEEKNEKIAMENNTHSQQELVGKDGGKKSRKKLVALITVVVVIAVVIVALVVGLQDHSSKDTAEPLADKVGKLSGKNITVDDYLSGKYSPRSFNGSWISDTEILYMDQERNLKIYDMTTSTSSVLVSSEIINKYRLLEYHLSSDRNYLMLAHDAQKLFRYSFLARFTLYNIETNEAIPLQTTSSHIHTERLQYAVWAPESNAVAFVFENDIYYKADPTTETVRITTTGIVATDATGLGPIYNGVADWVYEEEVLGTHSAIWFSPDGSKMAFATFNDTGVEHINYPYYGPFLPQNQYPVITTIPYPKPGTKNAAVSISITNLRSGKFNHLSPPSELSDYYFTAVGWADNDDVTVVWLNRTQNLAFLEKYGAPNYEPERLQRFTSKGWLDISTPPKFSSDGTEYLMILPLEISGDEWPNIISMKVGSSERTPVTQDQRTVTSIKHWDQDNNIVYYRSTQTDGPGIRHVFKVEQAGVPECVTCSRLNHQRKPCLSNNAYYSKQATYVTHACSGTETVTKVSIEDVGSGSELLLWEDNELVSENMEEMPDLSNFYTEVEVEGGFKAKVSILLPLDYQPEGTKKYPLVVYTYAGPNSQLITSGWRGIDWGAVLASHGIAYAMIDGRGSGYRGNNLMFELYRQLGTVEVQDQISVAKYLTSTYSWLDEDNVGIWGWSYGGYVSGMALATDTDNVFKCAVSVAPVTSWMYYDSIYTERYMGLPYLNDNFEAYNKSDISNHAEGIRGKSFYLIHGNADDNVHYQQSMMLSKKLEHSDILFQQQSYPDEAHGLSTVRRHLYHSMEKFWLQCFNMDE